MVHKFAFGELGWKPYEYYTSSPYEFFAASEGYFDKGESLAGMIRMASYRIHQSLVQKPLSIEDFWRLWGDGKKEDTNWEMDADMFEKIKAAHGIN